jgi:hypothetical protein
MDLYRFWLRRNGEDDAQEVDYELADDLEALRTAEALSVDFDVEVTHGARFVARIMKRSRVTA